MFNIAAVFSPGFEKVIPGALNDVLPDAKNLQVTSGFVRFTLDKKPFRSLNAEFLNNSFLVIKEWKGGNAPKFEAMANKIRIPDNIMAEIISQHYKTYRLRFSKANVFTSVNKQVTANVERQITQATGLRPNRLGGDTEFWFLTRADGYACFALRMTKKQSTEKYLEKGELRPEFVTLLAAFGGISKKDEKTNLVVLDPFMGHGGIVKRLSQMLPQSKIFTSEIEADLVKKLPQLKNVEKKVCSATKLDYVEDKFIDRIITDPPWGFWQGDLRDDKKLLELYEGMLKEFFRVIKADGKIAILTAAKEVFEKAYEASSFAASGIFEMERNDVLVNGKKSAVYTIVSRT